MKNLIIILFFLTTIVATALAFHYNQISSKAQKYLNEERYGRLSAEEILEKTSGKIHGLEKELANAQLRIKNIEKLLEKSNSNNTNLKSQLDETSKAKKDLEAKVKALEETPVKTASNTPGPM